MNCPNCQTQNPDGARFCFNCGTALSLKCSNCGTELPAGARFCFNCGQATGVAAPAPAPSQPAAQPPAPAAGAMLQRYIPKGLLSKLEAARKEGLVGGERRIVTILFCDVKGSTAAASRLDPEEWSEIINGAFEHMIGPVYAYEGTVARLMGDGLLAFFGAPIAHEDDPQRAVLAGLDIVGAIAGYAEEIKERWDLDFAVRVGINTGLVVVGAVGSDLRMEYTALGDAINLAARMEQTAVPGTVQIAGPTHKLVEPLFNFDLVEGLEVKGVEGPVTAYRVLGRRAEPGSLRGIAGLQAPLVGRQAQLEVLRAAVDGLRGGTGRIVSVIGEAGLGKSRLIAELRRATEGDPAFKGRWVEGRSQSFETNTPFAPFIDLLDDYFELEEGRTDEAQVGQIRAQIEALLPGQGQALAPFFATTLGLEMSADDEERVKYLDPPHLRGLIFKHLHTLLDAQLAGQSLVIFLDDLHWADPTSLELLGALFPLADQRPLLLLTAFRPRHQEPSWTFHEAAGRDYPHRYQSISLSPLDQGQSRELVANLLAIEDLPEGVRQTILDKSEGNPFFVEEIIRSLLDAGLVIRENGHWRATREIVDITIPDTLVGVITARLDRLEESTRQIVQAAAVLGREFTFEVLGDVAVAPESLESAITSLQRREIIREKSRLPRRKYFFKHALTQQASYDSILLSNRRELHRRAAESLIQRVPDQAADIARHWLGARHPDRALPFLVEAGDKAARAYAAAEAIDFYSQVLELGGESADLETLRRAYEELGNVLSFANRILEAMRTFEELLALGEERQDVATQISALNKLASTAGLQMGQFQQADGYLARAKALAQQYDEQSGSAETTLVLCQMCTARADFEAVVHHMSELAELGERLGEKEYVATGLEHLGSSLMWLTRFDEAQEKAQEALALSLEIGDRGREAWIQTSTLAMCAIRDGDFEAARAYLAEGLRVAAKIGAQVPQIVGNWIEGELAQYQGNFEDALSFGKQALALALPVEEFMPWFVVPPLGSLGSAYLHISEGFRDEITKFHQHALKLLETPAAMMMGGAAWADLGFCALKLGDLELAGQSFQKGLNVPTMFMYVEKPRLLAGSALLALANNDSEGAVGLAQEAVAFAQKRKMRHVYPLTQLTLAKALAALGDHEVALAAYDRAEAEALALGMRPSVVQARREAAGTLAATGREDAARAKHAAAKALIEEIAGLMSDETLRDAYRQSALATLGVFPGNP